jgi:tripartite-type tricarboxylate transporter receptor subunit TctC
VIGAIESGQIKALALASSHPLARLPKLPLASATKGFEDYQFSIWIGVAASAKTPDSQIAAVHKATYTALGNPEIRKIIETAGSTVAEPMTLAQLDTFYKNEAVTAAAIAKSIKLEPQ